MSANRDVVFRAIPVMRIIANAIRLGPGTRWGRWGNLVVSLALAVAVSPAATVSTTVLAASVAFGQAAPEVDGRIRELDAEAQRVFASADQADSVLLFTDLIEILDARAVDAPLGEPYLQVLIRSLVGRAEARFNDTVDMTLPTVDLRRVIEQNPAHLLDEGSLQAALVTEFNQMRSQMVGVLNLVVSTPEAVTLVDDELVDASRPISLLTGPHTVVVQRLGFAEHREVVEIESSVQADRPISLRRVSAVVKFFTRPAGVRISVNSEPVGETTGAASDGEFSEALVLQGLAVGAHTVELTLEGYRDVRAEIEVTRLDDFDSTYVLEPESGWVLLEGLPDDATVSVDGDELTPEPPDDASPAAPRLALKPGDHTISIVDSRANVFEDTVTVVDEGRHILQVQLRTSIAVLGILGADEIGHDRVFAALEQADGALEQWAILSREEGSETVLEQVGVTAARLRRLATADRVDATVVDWNAVQTAVDQYTPASMYMVGVLNDDTYAGHADFWVWLRAPEPSLPGHIRVVIEDEPAATIRDGFAAELVLSRPWLGAVLIDSDAATGPVVARIAEEGPAAMAGLVVGDIISTIGAQPVETVAAAEEGLLALERNPATIEVIRMGRAETVEVFLESSPSVAEQEGATALYPAVLSLLDRRLEADRDASEPAWVIQLNQAAVLMRAGAWDHAIDTLRRITDAPTGPGLGQAAVDYWLGIASSTISEENARRAFSRAASVPGATLYHNDGPLVAPLAQARCWSLGCPSPTR